MERVIRVTRSKQLWHALWLAGFGRLTPNDRLVANRAFYGAGVKITNDPRWDFLPSGE